MKKQLLYLLAAFAAGALACAFLICYRDVCSQRPVESIKSDTIRISDTIVIRDTIRIVKPKPYYVQVVRTDTIARIDTLTVTIPIEQRTYKDEQYQAVIEGYKPRLVSMEVYNKTVRIHDTIRINNTITRTKPLRWAVSAGPGIGYGPKGVEPYVGIQIGYVIWGK